MRDGPLTGNRSRRLVPVVVTAVVLAACSGRSHETSPARARPTTTAPTTTAPTTTTPFETDLGDAAPVPARYRALYDHLSTNLDAYAAAVHAMPAARRRSPTGVAGAELLPANGNRLRALLRPGTMTAVDAFLDRFRAMGIRGVTVGIKLPMLLDRFGPDAQAYVRFYESVAGHVRARGMTLDVELGALFCGTAYAACAPPYRGSSPQFVADSVQQARIVIHRIRPRYLDILSEPTTEAALTGVRDFGNPAGAARYVHQVLAGIGPRGATEVGAGAATWLPAAFDEAILAEPVDFLAVHIYPLNPVIAATVVQDAALARRAHKAIVADEIGLYKTDRAGSTPATADTVYRLDDFSFFEPLDIRFVTITATWAEKAGAAYVSPFWSGQFFAYLTWTPALDAAPFATLTASAATAITAALASGRLSAYGEAWPTRS